MQHSARPSPGIRATTLDEGDNLGSTIAVLWLNITFRSCNWRNSRRFEQRASIASALEEARDSLAKLGADVTVHSSPNVSVSAAIEQALVHLVREGATNIAKHATEHPSVTIQIEAIENNVRLELANSIAETPRNSLVPSSGYGLDRLRERVSLLGGDLSTQMVGGTWTLTARLPAR